MALHSTENDGVEWIHAVQDRVQWQVVENTATSYQAKQRQGQGEAEKSTVSGELCSTELEKYKE